MKGAIEGIIEKRAKIPVVFKKTIVPIYYPEGSLMSLKYLDELLELGDTCDIFITDVIQSLLLYKQR